jgi:hypothetical protein
MRRSERFPSRWLKAEDLPPEGKRVVVEEVKQETVGSGKNAETKSVLYFKNATKQLVLNSTNDRAIGDLAGSDDDEDWAGLAIVVYPTTTMFGAETVPCIRVRAVDGEGNKAKKPSAKRKGALSAKDENENPAPEEEDKPSLANDLDDSIPF